MSGPVIVEQADAIQLIRINRPAVRNAIDRATAEAIAAAVDQLDASPDITVGVITGAGPSFCAGMDLKAFLAGERPTVAGRGFAGLVERPPAKPLIAAVEGYAVAGGFEIVLACDLIVASETAVFGLPEVRRGLVAAGGGLLRLPERIPYQLAVEWALTGKSVSAREAHAVGLVNRLVPTGEALRAARELGEEIAANAPLAVLASKQILAQGRHWSPGDAFDRTRLISEPVRSSADAAEGARAFGERRAPVWTAK